MARDREEKRAALKERLVVATEALIAENGLRGLKARDITAQAGCALGALYTVVEGLDDLIVLVNSRTLNRLGQSSMAHVPQDAPPEVRMQALGQIYGRFAMENANLWSALFTHRLPDGVETPAWHKAEFGSLIQQITGPLEMLRPDLQGDALRQRAQTLFAAVHGVVQLSVHGFDVGAPRDRLLEEIDALVTAMMLGVRARGAEEEPGT